MRKRTIFAAALTLGLAAAAIPAAAQDAGPADHRPTARNGLAAQLDRLSGEVDRLAAAGRLGRQDAARIRRQINDLQAEASDARLRSGGQLETGDRFDLQARIADLEQRTRRLASRGAGPAP